MNPKAGRWNNARHLAIDIEGIARFVQDELLADRSKNAHNAIATIRGKVEELEREFAEQTPR